MGKVKLLLDVIEDIRSLADSLEAVADAMSHPDSPEPKAEDPKAPAPTAVEEAPTSAATAMGMGGGLPISGFYEMKQEIYEIYKRLSGKKYISELFSVEPETWGLRGDPYLWKYLKDRLSTTVVPENESELKALLINDIEEVIHAELTDHSETYVEDFAHGGMSSGYVSGQFWLKRGIPMLCERLKA